LWQVALKTIIVFLLRFLAVALIVVDSPRQYPPLCIPTEKEIDPEDLKNERINFCSGVFMLIISWTWIILISVLWLKVEGVDCEIPANSEYCTEFLWSISSDEGNGKPLGIKNTKGNL